MPTDLSERIPAPLRVKYQQTSQRFTPTVQALMFGNVAALAQHTTEAQRLASLASDAQRTWRAVHDTHWACLSDATATEAGRLIRSAGFAKAQLDRINGDFDRALTDAETRLATLKRSLDGALKPPSDVGSAMLDAEARALIRNASTAEAAIRLANAHPRAVATASTDLLGINPETFDRIRAEHLNAVLPEESAAYTDLLAAVRSAGTARAAIEQESRELIDFDTAAKLSASQVTA